MKSTRGNHISWHRSVVFRLIVVVILCVGVAQGAALYFTTQRDDHSALEHFKEDHINILQAHSEVIGSLLWRLQYDQLERVLTSLLSDHAVISVSVKDATGVVIAEKQTPDHQAGIGDPNNILISNELRHINQFVNDVVGSVDMVLTTEFLQEETTHRFIERLVIFLLSAVSIIVATSIAARKLLSKPLSTLHTAIERTKDGERGVRVPFRKPDEVGVLFQSFNGFMQSSEEYRDVINGANLRLTELALKDELTGLFNRRAALQKFKDLKDHTHVSIFFIDVDHFKTINDLYGHDGGDALLRTLAARIHGNIDPVHAKAFRIGGDEFIVVQENLHSATEAAHLAEDLMNKLTGRYLTRDHEHHIAVSIGVYFGETTLDSFDDVVAMASRALREAKSKGRNRTVLLDQDMRDEAFERIALTRTVQDAITNRYFETYLHTRHSARTGEVVGAEALSRCVLPDGQIIGPLQFMPIIEENHLSLEHGKILITQACGFIKPLREKFGQGFRLSLNVNAHQLVQQEFWSFFASERKRFNVPTSAFEVEITETSLISNFNVAIDVLKEFRDDGGLIALDDFGTGYSSLSYLTKLPIDIIKLDREFSSSAVNDERNSGILKATILLAQSIGAIVVSEGIETEQEEEFMKSAGVHYLQGYRFSRPAPLSVTLDMKNLGDSRTAKAV